MPIEAKFISHDRDAVFELVTVEPGQPFRFMDQSTKVVEFIVVICHDQILGGEIHIVSEDQMDEATASLGKSSFRQYIYPGFSYQDDIIDFEGERGRLILQHITPNGFIQSYN